MNTIDKTLILSREGERLKSYSCIQAWKAIYPMDSVIQPSKNWGLEDKNACSIEHGLYGELTLLPSSSLDNV